MITSISSGNNSFGLTLAQRFSLFGAKLSEGEDPSSARRRQVGGNVGARYSCTVANRRWADPVSSIFDGDSAHTHTHTHTHAYVYASLSTVQYLRFDAFDTVSIINGID